MSRISPSMLIVSWIVVTFPSCWYNLAEGVEGIEHPADRLYEQPPVDNRRDIGAGLPVETGEVLDGALEIKAGFEGFRHGFRLPHCELPVFDLVAQVVQELQYDFPPDVCFFGHNAYICIVPPT